VRPGLRALFLVYNRQIKEETRKDLKDLSDRVKVHSYDAAVTEYYDATAPMTDFQLALKQVLDGDVPVRAEAEGGEGLRFDLLVVDEAQDIDELYMRLLEKLLRDNTAGAPAQIVSVGDPKQRIYGYRGASNAYFISDNDEGLYRGRRDVETMTLSVVFRFGARIAEFVNKVCKPLFQSQAASHWREDHRCHRCSENEEDDGDGGDDDEDDEDDEDVVRDSDPPVLRYVLPKDDRRPDALLRKIHELHLAYPGDPPVVMTGSRLEWNRPMWLSLEQLQDWEPHGQQHLVTEDPQARGEATVLVVNAHGCKGRDYTNVVLYLTNPRTWLDEKGEVNAEIFYVALTRCKRQLIIVESFQSLVFQRVVQGLAPLNLMPQPRCAASGLPDLGVELELCKQPSFAKRPKPDLKDFIERSMDYQDKGRALALIETGPLALWTESSSAAAAESEGLDALETLALWLRHDHLHGTSDRFGAFLRALEDPTLTAEQAYAELSDYPRLFTPRLRGVVERVRAALPVAAWDWGVWLEATTLHASFHCGHSLLRRKCEDRTPAMQEAWRQLQQGAASGDKLLWCGMVNRAYGHRGVYLSQAGDAVRLLVLEATTAERVLDRLVAACAAADCHLECYSIAYLAQGQCVQGRLREERRLEYRDVFRRAMDLR
jgi:hypothetical protein